MVSAEPDLTGALLEGRYQVGELLAVGGMSRVYRGLDTRLDRAVAIKVMDPRLAADPAFRQRFEREARAVARIDHPGVVDVYDQGEDTGNPISRGEQAEPVVYLVMELVLGGTLRDVLRSRGALSVPEALAVLEPVLAGLASAHEQGLAHRDVKPENVLIGDSGTVKVADFGLVTAAAQANATSTGMIIGTVAYLSPEQVTGQGIDARSDVYAAGVMLYELLTGVPPYDGEYPVSVAYQHVNKDMPAPSETVPGIPPDIDALVLAATRRDPNARPPDAGTLLHAVRGVRASLGIPRVPVPLPGSATPQLGAALDSSGGDLDSATVPHTRVPTAKAPRPTRALTSLGDWAPASPGATPAADNWQDVGDEHVLRRRRSRRILAACVAGVGLLGVIIGVIAWNAGLGYWATVPKVVGMDQGVATQNVQAAGLVPNVRQRHDNAIPAGKVATTTPAADTHVAKGSAVEIVVSSGRPVVPRISPGTPVAQAEQILRNSDLVARQNPSSVHSHPTAPPGTVVATSPAAGTELNVGAPVTLVLSTGPRHSRSDDEDEDENGEDHLRRSIVDRIEDGLSGLFGGH